MTTPLEGEAVGDQRNGGPPPRAGWRPQALGLKEARSDKVRASLAFIAAAVAFAGANLLLARHLEPAVYGVLALMVAIIVVGSALGPLGLGIMVVRQHLPAHRRLLLHCAGTATLVAAGAGTVAWAYGVAPVGVATVALGVFGGAFIRLASGKLQSDERFVASTLVSESLNYLLLLAALLAIGLGLEGATEPILLVALAQVLLATTVWLPLLASDRHAERPVGPLNLTEMALLTGTNAAMLVLLQVERFAIPMFLNVEQLAAFAVLAVFTIAPFRPIEFGTYRTLLPRLRRPASVQERRRILLKEVIQTLVALAALALALLAVTPYVLHWLFGGKYTFSLGAVLAAIVGGQMRVARALVAATISALADQRGLAFWNVASWITVGAAFLGGWAGSPWGLEGFLWGVAAAGLTNILITVPVARRALRAPARLASPVGTE